jgi:hypothetical protein
MSRSPVDPDLASVTAAFLRAGASFVVIGGFAVIANDYVRATEDVDLLVPDDSDNDIAIDRALNALGASWPDSDRPYKSGEIRGRDHTRLWTQHGLIDLLREGAPPLDFVSVRDHALRSDLGDGEFLLAGLASLVAFKRLAGRPRDRSDLAELEAIHGELPVEPVPGLDT